MTERHTSQSPSPVPRQTLADRVDLADPRWLDWLVYLLLPVLAVYVIFGFWGLTYDDVYLAFQYAKNLEAGHGFVFNAGEQVLGTPAPLFVMLLVLVHRVLPFLTLPQVGSVISGLGLTLTSFALYQIGRGLGQRWVGLLAALIVALNPFTAMTLGGETPSLSGPHRSSPFNAIMAHPQQKYSMTALALFGAGYDDKVSVYDSNPGPHSA